MTQVGVDNRAYESNNNVVVNVINQQPQAALIIKPERDWSDGLCDCGKDCHSCCCIAWCCFCYVCCCIYPRYGEHCCTACWLSPIALLLLRVKHRGGHMIRGGLCGDFCCTQCCGPCVACRLVRDMNYSQQNEGFL